MEGNSVSCDRNYISVVRLFYFILLFSILFHLFFPGPERGPEGGPERGSRKGVQKGGPERGSRKGGPRFVYTLRIRRRGNATKFVPYGAIFMI